MDLCILLRFERQQKEARELKTSLQDLEENSKILRYQITTIQLQLANALEAIDKLSQTPLHDESKRNACSPT